MASLAQICAPWPRNGHCVDIADYIKEAFVPLTKNPQSNRRGTNHSCKCACDFRITRSSDFTLVLQLLSTKSEARAEIVVSSLISFLLELPEISLEYVAFPSSSFPLVKMRVYRS